MPDEIDEPGTSTGSDPGLATLVMCLRFQGVAADPAQIGHRFGGVPIGVTEMLRCAKELGLKARVHRTRVPQALWNMDNVVLLPHQASATIETRRAMADLVLGNLAAHFAGREPLTPV
jgi:ABC-type bacteriocin/lantibiotic exporter with double-glycine peptidase domain